MLMPASATPRTAKSANETAATYAAFLAAIAARDFERICELATDRLRTSLRGIRTCAEFPALFGMWCESYPKVATSAPVHCDDSIAIFDIEGNVDGTRVRARVLLQRVDGRWRIDKEQFRASREPVETGRNEPRM